MNRMSDFENYRKTYPEFHYHSFAVSETDTEIVLKFHFEISGLAEFHPELKLLKKSLKLKSIDSAIVQNLAFHIGLVELISYWKPTCSPRVIIHCGRLNADQITWWKKLYYYGLGELFYTNGIKTSMDDFTQIYSVNAFSADNPQSNGPRDRRASPVTTGTSDAASEGKSIYEADLRKYSGYMVTIGGGKDSIVTLETLDLDRARDYCFIMNPKPVTRECTALANFSDDHVIELYRQIDPELLSLNQKGFLNGHIPFSAVLAFITYFVAYLAGLGSVVVSNESSANESNLACSDDPELACAKVNHQYSKSFEFEQDFARYAEKYFHLPIKYFSFLRPLNELQIAKIFARLEKYHPVFKSCNVGSKGSEWVWCGRCSKCLFAFTILSPYLYPDKLVEIFHKDLFADENLLPTFLELTGHSDHKPFDCVGTFAEVNFALSLTIRSLLETGRKLPYLLQYYYDSYGLADLSDDLTTHYNTENFLSPEQNTLLKQEVFRNV